MAPSYIHHHNHNHHTLLPPPSLSDLSTVASTRTSTSIRTSLASQIAAPSHFPVLEDNNGVLEHRPSAPVYECTFWFLSCGYVSTEKEEWTTHCASHWRGREPPRSIECPICPSWTLHADTAYDSSGANTGIGWHVWTQRMEHVASHYEDSERLGARTRWRREAELYRYLWRKKLIDSQGLKDLLSEDGVAGAFVVTGGGNGDAERAGREMDRRRGFGGRGPGRGERGGDRERERVGAGGQYVGVVVAGPMYGAT